MPYSNSYTRKNSFSPNFRKEDDGELKTPKVDV